MAQKHGERDQRVHELTGQAGHDHSKGSDGGEGLQGAKGNGELGGLGHRVIHGGKGDDVLAGGPENDMVHGGKGSDIIDGGPGNDLLRGGKDNDKLAGGLGDDALYGEKGDDTLAGGIGSDYSEGGAGSDIYIALKSGNEIDQIVYFDWSNDQDSLVLEGFTATAVSELTYLSDPLGDFLYISDQGEVPLQDYTVALFSVIPPVNNPTPLEGSILFA